MLFQPKILHNHCLQFLFEVKLAPRETENNAYAYGIFCSGQLDPPNQ